MGLTNNTHIYTKQNQLLLLMLNPWYEHWGFDIFNEGKKTIYTYIAHQREIYLLVPFTLLLHPNGKCHQIVTLRMGRTFPITKPPSFKSLSNCKLREEKHAHKYIDRDTWANLYIDIDGNVRIWYVQSTSFVFSIRCAKQHNIQTNRMDTRFSTRQQAR